MQLSILEQKIGYIFREKDLLREALTHRSYLNENSSWGLPTNERLEFLGDAVIELIVTEELFLRFPTKPEGELTPIRSALVNYQMMAKVAGSIGLGDFVLLSRGEAKDTGRAREVILANALEAVIGAVYLDGGYAPAKLLVKAILLERLDEVMRMGLYRDAKSVLQEKIQEKLKITPTYRVLEESGPDHQKLFSVGVYFGEKLAASGNGPSKQDAEVEAAKAALEQIK
ncbi:MAG: ribonuclease III [Patescibacteria group bacterium]